MLKYDKELCTGCRLCEVICSFNRFQIIAPRQSFIQYVDNWPQVGFIDFCRQCKGQKCIEACPQEDALFVNEHSMVELNHAACTKCLECSELCPFGELPVNGGYPLFCDTCLGEYSCVKWCPTRALSRGDE